jgi:tRNA(fMet)-specific endonuclease VapC
MIKYMLDTNAVSCMVKKHPILMQKARNVPVASLCISTITEGELLFGLAKRPEAKKLHAAIKEFLLCVDVMPWDKVAAKHYARIRASLEYAGKTLAPLDLLIASHAESIGAVLITNDQAFRLVGSLCLEDWTDG